MALFSLKKNYNNLHLQKRIPTSIKFHYEFFFSRQRSNATDGSALIFRNKSLPSLFLLLSASIFFLPLVLFSECEKAVKKAVKSTFEEGERQGETMDERENIRMGKSSLHKALECRVVMKKDRTKPTFLRMSFAGI